MALLSPWDFPRQTAAALTEPADEDRKAKLSSSVYLPSRPNFIKCSHNVMVFPIRRMMSWYQNYLFMYFLSDCSCHANRKRKKSAFTSAICVKNTVCIVYIRVAHNDAQRRLYFGTTGSGFTRMNNDYWPNVAKDL